MKSSLSLVVILAAMPVFSAEPTVDFDGKSKKTETVIIQMKDKATDFPVAPSIEEPPEQPVGESGTAVDTNGQTKDMFEPGTILRNQARCNYPGHAGTYAVCLQFLKDQPFGHNHNIPPTPPVVFLDTSVPYPGLEDYVKHCYLRVPLNTGVNFLWRTPAYATDLVENVAYLPSPGGPLYCNNSPEYDVLVGVSGLQQLLPGLGYQLEPGTSAHPEIFYGQMITVNSVQAIAAQYAGEFASDMPLPIMRISLPKGGLFDIDDDWIPPLVQHRRGWEVDVKSVYIPQEHRARFEEIVQSVGGRLVSCPGQYYHIDFRPGAPLPACD